MDFQTIIALGQGLGLSVLAWIIHLIKKTYKELKRTDKLNQIQTEALVDALSPEYGNGDFRKRYDKFVQQAKDNYKFVKD